jgi:hypothetical protein
MYRITNRIRNKQDNKQDKNPGNLSVRNFLAHLVHMSEPHRIVVAPVYRIGNSYYIDLSSRSPTHPSVSNGWKPTGPNLLALKVGHFTGHVDEQDG